MGSQVSPIRISFVIPAEAGIHKRNASKEPRPQRLGIPAFAGMTELAW